MTEQPWLIDKSALARLAQSSDLEHHRGPSIPDLLIAATAELSGLVVPHVDKDFDTIAALTGQPAIRLTTTR